MEAFLAAKCNYEGKPNVASMRIYNTLEEAVDYLGKEQVYSNRWYRVYRVTDYQPAELLSRTGSEVEEMVTEAVEKYKPKTNGAV